MESSKKAAKNLEVSNKTFIFANEFKKIFYKIKTY